MSTDIYIYIWNMSNEMEQSYDVCAKYREYV